MAIRPYQDLSDEDLANQIAELQGRGVRPTPITYSGLVEPSDYTSPMGTRGLRVQQSPEDVELNAIRAEKNALEKDMQTRKDYWNQMEVAENRYNQSMASAFTREQKDRLTKDLQDVERQLQGYTGNVPRGTQSFYSKWSGGVGDSAPIRDKGYRDLLKQKYAIQNALLGQKIDVGQALPDVKTGGQLVPGPGGSLLQVNEDGTVTRVLDREKEPKEKKKPEASYVEKKEIDLAIETLKDKSASDEDRIKATELLQQMNKKYGGIFPEDETETTAQGEPIPKSKKVVRTGKDKKTGRKIVQYEDGTMSYAD